MGLGRTIKKAYMKGKKKAYGSKGVKGRYIRPGFTKGMGNLIKDVEMIKSRLNVEKKHKDRDVITYNVGQVNNAVDGAFAADVTPIISQGTDSDERIGNSLKFTGMTLPMSFTQQVQCLGDRKVRVSLLRVKAADNDVTATEAFQHVWDVNPLTGVRDFNAPRAYRNSKNDGISVIRSKVYTVKGPQLDNSSLGISATERNVLTCRFSVKLEDILRYEDSSQTYPQGIRYILVIQCNAGNMGGGTSTLDVPVVDASSALDVRIGQRN
jgi:hypothetical protein